MDVSSLYEQRPNSKLPLVYYLPAGGDWAHAFGIEVLPLYEERKSTAVTIRVLKECLDRVESLSDSELKVIVGRFADAFSRHYSRWENLTAEWPGSFLEWLGETVLTQPFASNGWHLVSKELPASFLWERPRRGITRAWSGLAGK